MSSIPEILNFIQFSRTALLESIAGLSVREMTEIPVYAEGWTVKEILAHILGWDRRVVSILPLILAGRADEVPGIDVPDFNRQSILASRELSVAEILAQMEQTHRQILDILGGVDHKDIDLRRTRHGRTITIRSYIIDIMAEHERQHAVEIEQWRKTLPAH
jgi:hypothetical protein